MKSLTERAVLVIVSGGAASGKSELGERICVQLGAHPAYIATMQPFGDEAAQRIEKHRRDRAGRGFTTYEAYDCAALGGLAHPQFTIDHGCALLECMSNLCANEIFSAGAAPEHAPAVIMQAVERLMAGLRGLVIVTNEVCLDAEHYSAETRAYMAALAKVNTLLAAKADAVVESVCGIAVPHKGRRLLNEIDI